MNTQEQMEERLWDFIDGLSSPTERSTIEGLIAANLEWQRKYRELLEMHRLINATEADAPSMRFTKNVMEEISRHQVAPATKSYINKNIIRSIGAFFLLMIGGFVIYFLGQLKGLVSDSSSSSPSPTPPYSHVLQNNLNKFDWGKLFNNTYTSIFIMINVILALVLLDMYLQRKKEQARTHTH